MHKISQNRDECDHRKALCFTLRTSEICRDVQESTHGIRYSKFDLLTSARSASGSEIPGWEKSELEIPKVVCPHLCC
jgi:hypothetical protein